LVGRRWRKYDATMVGKVTAMVDFLLGFINVFGTRDVTALQLFFLLLNLSCSIPAVFIFFYYSYDIHVTFWLGRMPQVVNLSTPCVFLIMNVGISLLRFFRFSSYWTKRCILVLYTSLGMTLMILGIYIMAFADHVAENLIYECGTTTMTSELEREWRRLTVFHQECRARTHEELYVTACQGFNAIFTDVVMIDYIEDVEMDFNCVGFCQFWAEPLFNDIEDHSSRCASALGYKMEEVGFMVSLPTFSSGFLIAFFGCFFANYEHL